MLGNTSASDLLKLIFQNIAMALVGDAGGLQPSAAPGNLYISLHSADPGPAGDQTTNELAYTSYDRVAVARDNTQWTVSGASPTQVANANAITFPSCTGSSGTALYYAIGTAAFPGAGKIVARGPLTQTLLDFTAAVSDTLTIPGHALLVNDTIVFVDLPEGTLPTGVVEGTVYYVKTVSGNDITISATLGGATLDITAAGSGLIGKVLSLAITSGVTPQFGAGSLVAQLQ